MRLYDSAQSRRSIVLLLDDAGSTPVPQEITQPIWSVATFATVASRLLFKRSDTGFWKIQRTKVGRLYAHRAAAYVAVNNVGRRRKVKGGRVVRALAVAAAVSVAALSKFRQELHPRPHPAGHLVATSRRHRARWRSFKIVTGHSAGTTPTLVFRAVLPGAAIPAAAIGAASTGSADAAPAAPLPFLERPAGDDQAASGEPAMPQSVIAWLANSAWRWHLLARRVQERGVVAALASSNGCLRDSTRRVAIDAYASSA